MHESSRNTPASARMRAAARTLPPTGSFPSAVESMRAAREAVAAEQVRLDAKIAALDGAIAALSGNTPTNHERRSGRPSLARRVTRRRAKRGTVTLGILRALAENGPIKPAQVAASAGAKPTTVSTALDGLRRKKLASRSA